MNMTRKMMLKRLSILNSKRKKSKHVLKNVDRNYLAVLVERLHKTCTDKKLCKIIVTAMTTAMLKASKVNLILSLILVSMKILVKSLLTKRMTK